MPILFLTVLIDLIGFGIVVPVLPFLAPQLGANTFEIAVVIAIYSVFGGLAGPFWGRLSDRIGRKPVLLICLAGAAATHVMLAFSTTLTTLMISRALAGVMAGNFGVVAAIVADITTPQTRAKSMGMIGAAFGLGMVAGPFLGGVLAGEDGNFMLPALFAAGLSALALITGALLLRESLPPEQRHAPASSGGGTARQSVWQMLRQTHNTLLATQYFLNSGCLTAASYLFPLWVAQTLGWGPKEVGMVFGAQGLALAIVQGGLIGRLVQALGELRLLLASTVLMTAAFVLAGSADGMVAILIAFFAINTAGALCNPVYNTLIANRTPLSLRGRMLGTTNSSSAFGRVLGPLLAGAMLTHFGFHLAWFSGTLMALLMSAWVIGRLRDEPDEAAPVPVPVTGEKSHAGQS